MNDHQQAIIKSTLPLVKEHGKDIISSFYKTLFAKHPTLRQMFNMTRQADSTQQAALLNSIVAVAEHSQSPQNLQGALDLIAHKHASVGVEPHHYPIVAEVLMAAICETLGLEPETEVAQAWQSAVVFAADLLMSKEQHLRGGAAHHKIEVSLAEKIPEARDIVSLVFATSDGQAFPQHQPGQYISIDSHKESWEHSHKRQYSITSSPGDHQLQITVKRDPEGQVSSYLHEAAQVGDRFSVSQPFGNFVLDDSDDQAVLLSAGVGITPIYQFIEECCRRGRKHFWIHGDRSHQCVPFLDKIDPNTPRMLFLQNVGSHQIASQEIASGFVDLDKTPIRDKLPRSQIYLCGPKVFMEMQMKALLEKNVVPSRIHFEFFGSLQANPCA